MVSGASGLKPVPIWEPGVLKMRTSATKLSYWDWKGRFFFFLPLHISVDTAFKRQIFIKRGETQREFDFSICSFIHQMTTLAKAESIQSQKLEDFL